MSWLTDLFGGGDEGSSQQDRLWQIYFQQQEQARQDALAAAREEQARQSQATMQQQQIDYLNSLRADQAAKEAKLEAADPTATRQAALSSLGGVFTPEYESKYIPSTLTDPYEQAVYGEQRSSADELINRMLKRGVLTETGGTAARAELERQAPGVRAQLDKIGQGLLEAERGKLTDIGGRAKEAASTLGVNQPFDISPYGSALSSEAGAFSSGLSDLYRGSVPSDLFDTSTLGNVGGAAQFAGNQPFDPTVLSAAGGEEKPPEEQKPVQKRTATVF